MKLDIPVYCLHIIENKDRMQNIIKLKSNYDFFSNMKICEFTKVPINVKIGDMLESMHTWYYDSCKKSNITVYGGVFSCAYNWLQIIKCAYERGDEFAVFLEDDYYPNFTNMNDIVLDLPNDADFVKFGITYPYWRDEVNIINKTKHFVEVSCINGHETTISHNAMCFGMSRKAMKLYIDLQEYDFHAADMVFIKTEILNQLKIFMLDKPTIIWKNSSIV